MTNINENPCFACSTNHGCCTLKGACGLMLTKEEFDTHFKGHTDKLLLRSSRNFVVISSRDGFACPHLGIDGCKIYQSRPMDCRLFPYVVSHVFERTNNIRIVFHNRSDCPQKERLLQSTDEARSLVMKFARSVFGEDRQIIVTFDRNRTLLSRARNFIDRKWSERFSSSAG
ncbi:MAG: YkgJ family cysteine cluster protein [Desulfuromonadaceae bacterium]|nr:YkgJ family cysteine cluster protein [Desulfuromonadaceae bacterium]